MAHEDSDANRVLVYYLDYKKTYKTINNFTAPQLTVSRLIVIARSDGVFHLQDQK